MPPQSRSYNMSRIRAKNTKPEMIVRKWLWGNGYRYFIHKHDLPGKPDIVFSKKKIAIFVHGCFWHRHGCKLSVTPKTNVEFWENKFKSNLERDKKNYTQLQEIGWHVLIIWACEINHWITGNPSPLKNYLDSHKKN
ncbi:very short patch repair endonuclease [Chromobacterium violaceum]|uniref:very short patch repair endonuclease n=1 Tax=Chromobacterium violaceum TaxID=536 RepID=UPI0009DB57B0|nr:very short patch repair endonuclease [Chromobacterium violaceum]OQS19790.1 very short patch repair endonuclease [Chromobacterium violaceum]